MAESAGSSRKIGKDCVRMRLAAQIVQAWWLVIKFS